MNTKSKSELSEELQKLLVEHPEQTIAIRNLREQIAWADAEETRNGIAQINAAKSADALSELEAYRVQQAELGRGPDEHADRIHEIENKMANTEAKLAALDLREVNADLKEDENAIAAWKNLKKAARVDA